MVEYWKPHAAMKLSTEGYTCFFQCNILYFEALGLFRICKYLSYWTEDTQRFRYKE
jgi:hypothetical protein